MRNVVKVTLIHEAAVYFNNINAKTYVTTTNVTTGGKKVALY